MKILQNKFRMRVTMLTVVALLMFSTPGYSGPSQSHTFDTSNLSVPQSYLDTLDSQKTETYIVMMYDLPIVAYDGEIAGLDATKAPEGQKVDPNSANAKQYESYLVAEHDAVLASIGLDASAKTYDYTFAANGFAAQMTELQAITLNARSDVFSVLPNEIVYTQTDNSGTFLGLNDDDGAWDEGFTGKDVVIGVIDTGIWPEHPSFDGEGYGPAPASFVGVGCDFGDTTANPNDAPFECNNKLLAAKSYNSFSWLHPNEFNSARDSDGHGSHTASTAGGNAGVEASIFGIDRGVVSGVAPEARLSIYKACWNDAGCFGSDLTMAIDDAVADGVDVINYSIGSSSFAIGSDDMAFLFAGLAGVMVATSNGNSGPGASTTGSPASVPWVTSVGASTQDRTFEGSVILGDGSQYFGASVTEGVGPLQIVDAADYGNELCDPDVSFTSSIEGDIVLCKRGGFARVEKSRAVFDAGGAGTVLYNSNPSQSLVTDNHWGPGLHISYADGLLVKAYIAANSGSATATMTAGVFAPTQGSVIAAFSSRGPNRQSSDIIKPDVTAPGVNILAANSPYPYLGTPGQNFQSISGTSMSSPHVAGLFALLSQARPNWTPSMAKSALMTTARQDVFKEDGVTPADAFDMGAGHVDPSGEWEEKGSVINPGLIYDVDQTGTDGFFDYAAYTCGAGLGVFSAGSCDFLAAIGVATDPSDLNIASIGVGELVGSQTVTRTVTAAQEGNGWKTYYVNIDAPDGFDVVVSPESFKIRNGMTVTYTVTITNDGTANIGEWSQGSLTWTTQKPHDMDDDDDDEYTLSLSSVSHDDDDDDDDDKKEREYYTVYSPIAVRAFEIDVPSVLHLSGLTGSTQFDVKFGFSGSYSATAQGLVAASTEAENVVDDPANDINTALATGIGITWQLVYQPNSLYTRISLFDEFTDGIDDLDLYVWNAETGAFVGGSGSGTSEEQVDIEAPTASYYLVGVHGWETDGPDSNYVLFSWGVPAAVGGGSLSVDSAPSSASVGAFGTVVISWTGLNVNTKYLGAVAHRDSIGIVALTLISVNT